jgi:hypothetical protein
VRARGLRGHRCCFDESKPSHPIRTRAPYGGRWSAVEIQDGSIWPYQARHQWSRSRRRGFELKVTGLSRRDQQAYYEAWLKNATGILVRVGTFNQGPSITLWAGVSPVDVPTLTVTEQQVGRSQASSGKGVLTGSVDIHR